MEKIKLVLSILLICIAVFVIYIVISLKSFRLYERPLILYEGDINNKRIKIEEVFGGATSKDYLIIRINDEVVAKESIIDSLMIDNVSFYNDSLIVDFTDSVYLNGQDNLLKRFVLNCKE